MTALAWLIPAALLLGGIGLLAFIWSLRSGQFDDLDGAAYRVLEDDAPPMRGVPDDSGDVNHDQRTDEDHGEGHGEGQVCGEVGGKESVGKLALGAPIASAGVLEQFPSCPFC